MSAISFVNKTFFSKAQMRKRRFQLRLESFKASHFQKTLTCSSLNSPHIDTDEGFALPTQILFTFYKVRQLIS